MSFGWTAAVWTAIGVGVSAVGTVSSMDSQRKAGNQAKDAAAASARAAEEAQNKANARKPDTAAAMAAAILAGKSGQSGTMLTGPSGIDTNSLMLGRATLLGGG